VGEGVIRIRTDEAGVDYAGAGKKAGGSYSSGFKSSLKGLAVAVGGALAIGKGIDLLKGSVAEAREAQKVAAKTEQIIKATGSAAGITADGVGKMAGRLSNFTGIDDEAIQSGANLLLTFKNVKNYVDGEFVGAFDRATAASLDLSAAGFGSIEGSAKTMGKALNDPVKGISALSRAGVTFTDQQKRMIERMVEVGDVAGAQNIILSEVESQVGGVAAASATAGEKASVAWGNIKESIGTLLLPALDQLADIFTTSIAPAIQDIIAGTSPLSPLFAGIGRSVGVISAAVNDLITGTSPLSPLINSIAQSIGGLFAGGGQASSFFDSLREAAETALPIIQQVIVTQVIPAVQELIKSLRDNFGPVIVQLVGVVQTRLLPVLQQLGQFVVTTLVPIWRSLWSFLSTAVIPLIGTLASFVVTKLIPPFLNLVSIVISKLQPVFQQLAETLQTKIIPTAQRVVAQIKTQLIPAITPLIQKVIAVGSWFVKLQVTILSKVLPPLIKLAGFIISKVIPAVVTIITKVALFVTGLINFVGAVGRAVGAAIKFAATLQTQVQKGISTVVSAVTALPGKIIALGGKMLTAGKSLMGKLFDGIRSAASGAGSLVSSIASSIADAAKGLINDMIRTVNNAIPDYIDVPGPKNIDLPNDPIPYLARGTRNFPGGLAVVGEEGPELVNLPAGSRVTPARQTERELAAGQLDLAALTTAIVAALAQMRPFTVVTDASDPAAVAMQVINRMATA